MSTYLGYQVRHLADDTQLLRDWLEKHESGALSIWGKTVVGSGCDYGVDPEEYPWNRNRDGSWDAIKDFRDLGDCCEFCTERESFVVRVTELPKDKWGNTATFSGGINLVEGCFEVGYSDDSYTEYKFPDFSVPGEPDYVYEIDDPQKFVNWLTENSELVGEITERTVHNGCGHEWTYYTTNKPFDSQEWIEAVQEYVEE